MSAERLREAARLMRNRATAADDGPWRWAEQTDAAWFGIQDNYSALGLMHDCSNAFYVASMHPAVALAVADLLTVFSMMPSASDPTGLKAALAVANAYLGTPDP